MSVSVRISTKVAAVAAGLLGSLGSWAGGADDYEATISLVNNTGSAITISGCNAVQKDDNKCSLSAGKGPVTIAAGESKVIGLTKNHKHSAQGYFSLHTDSTSKIFQLNYDFDKRVSNSSLSIADSGDIAGVLTNLYIDPTSCTRNPAVTGALRCCSFDKNSKYKFYRAYRYNCELPVFVANEAG